MRILSGIKPTGQLTLGNYLGALKHFKDYQNQGEVFIFIADLHALTLPIDSQELNENSRDIACYYLASGLDPKKTTIFLQSSVGEHAELSAILQNYIYMGELKRMTQFKDKSKKLNDSSIGLGLFAYPALMNADIVLYNTDIVPVGEDQMQHVELTHDLVKRFNHRYGDILVNPKAQVQKVGARIMSLSDPNVKMSKSDPKGDIFLKDDEKTIRKKIMSAKTDSGSEIKFDKENKPGISNLLTIYAATKDITIPEAEAKFQGYRYGDFKKAVADAVVEELIPFQQRYKQILEDKSYLKVLKDGRDKAKKVAHQTLLKVQKAVGILTLDE